MAMSTTWWLSAREPKLLAEAERLVRDVEARLSRFLPGSSLSTLNRTRHVQDPLLAKVVTEALKFGSATNGAFDATMGEVLIGAGYDRSFEMLAAVGEPAPRADVRPSVDVDGDRIFLHGPGTIDLGGIAKGWTVDRVAELLGYEFVVDGGGDIRVGGPEPWQIGLPGDRTLNLTNAAVATSSTAKRRWTTIHGLAHHVLTPSSGRPSTRGATAVVVASSAVVADAFATAILADPVRGMGPLAAFGGEAMLETDEWWMTPGMDRWLE